MIKNTLNFIWEVLVDIAEAKQERMRRNNYKMWY